MTHTSLDKPSASPRRLTSITLPHSRWNLVAVVVTLLAAGVASVQLGDPRVYVGAFLVTMGWYAMATGQLSARGKDIVEAEVVAEQIVVLGIVSLIVHVVFAAVAFNAQWKPPAAVPPEAIHEAATAFLAGLSCAAIAPIVAVLNRSFRQVPTEAEGPAGPGGGGSSISRLDITPLSMSGDTPGISEAHRLAAALSDAAGKLETSAQQFIATIDRAREGIDQAASRSSAALEGLSTSVSERTPSVEAAIMGLSTTVNAQIASVGTAFASLAEGIKDGQQSIAGALDVSAAGIRGAADPVRTALQAVAADIRVGQGAIAEALDGTAITIRGSADPVRTALQTVAADIRASQGPIGDAFKGTATTIRDSADPMARSLRELTVKIDEASTPLTSSLATLARDVQGSTTVLGDGFGSMETQLRTLQDGLSRVATVLSGSTAELGGALGGASTGTRNFTTDLESLAQRLRTTGEALQALEALILTVRRFVSPDAAAPAGAGAREPRGRPQ